MSRTRGTKARLRTVALLTVTALCAAAFEPAQPVFAASSTRTSPTGRGSLSAVFAPASVSSSGSVRARQQTIAGTAGSVPIAVTVPPTGTLTITIVPGPVIMQLSSNRRVATGMLQDVTVTDGRNYVPGWSVTGQESVFTRSHRAKGATIPGDELGWVPVAVSPLAGRATLGPAVAPGTTNGLGTGSVLAYAVPGAGLGTNTFSARLTLDISNSALASVFTGTLTITYLETGPQAGGTVGVGF